MSARARSPATMTARTRTAPSSRTTASSVRTPRWWRRCASPRAPTSAPVRPLPRTRQPGSSPWRARSRCRSRPGNRRENRRRRTETMCGIVGAAARRDIVPVLIEGLKRLEYRGYDSCGVAVLNGESIGRLRSVERVADLVKQVRGKKVHGVTGIAHTRWATHGAPVTRNAHPMMSRGEIAVVHNGIIENYEELRTELKAKGYAFDSQTDT